MTDLGEPTPTAEDPTRPGYPWQGHPDYDRATEIIHHAQNRNPEPVADSGHAEPEEPVTTPDRPGWTGNEPPPAPADPIVDSGTRLMVTPPPGEDTLADLTSPPVADTGERCTHCGGRMPTDHELLMEVLGWIAPAGNEAMHRFYVKLFEVDPSLRPLFPDRIEEQEEKLLSAIVALLKLFRAGDEEMEQLDSNLARFGRSHTRFDPAATIEEYAAVKSVLFTVLVDMLGDRLTDRHVKVLVRAYEYAAGKMLAAQATAQFTGVGRRRRTV